MEHIKISWIICWPFWDDCMKSVNGIRCRSTSAGEPALELLLWISAELIGIAFPGNRMRWVKIYLWWMSQGADSRLWQWVLYNVVRPELVCLSHHTPGHPLLCRVSWFHSTAGGNREGVQEKTHRALFWEKEPGRKARKAPEKQLKNVLWNAVPTGWLDVGQGQITERTCDWWTALLASWHSREG